LCLILISLLMCPPIPLWAGVGNYPRGDVNADGFIDGLDVLGLGDLLLNRPRGFFFRNRPTSTKIPQPMPPT